ncbi:MAG: hypothetical protein FD177_1801 [Desulfovibrionaceae bacterium]|nr:MAG: hypothetical protein FD177_1801 [Desulfovibrionaceae bacterium]
MLHETCAKDVVCQTVGGILKHSVGVGAVLRVNSYSISVYYAMALQECHGRQNLCLLCPGLADHADPFGSNAWDFHTAFNSALDDIKRMLS